MHWGPDWTPTPLPVFRSLVADAVQGDGWVVDGNYSGVRDIVWSRADAVIWLDYQLPVILGQLVLRTLRQALFSRYSIILWAIKTHHSHRTEYSALFDGAEYANLALVRLRTPRSTSRWLEGLGSVERSQSDC